jgi:inhibitor of cysteine peptidase
LAQVESVEVQVLDQSPPAILVIARGSLPDGCTSIGDTDWAQDGKTFKVTITTVRPEEMMCTQALVPFEETVMMKPADALAPGRYTVDANGVIATFEVT